MDEWIDSDDDSETEDEDKPKVKDEDDSDAEKKKKAKKNVPDKKKKRDLDDEAFEESDDGDEEGRELDYISDSSDRYHKQHNKMELLISQKFLNNCIHTYIYLIFYYFSEPDPESKANKEMSSVAEEDALRKLLTSDEDSDEEKKSNEEDADKDENNDNKNKKDAKDLKDGKESKDKRKKKLKKKAKDEKKGKFNYYLLNISILFGFLLWLW